MRLTNGFKLGEGIVDSGRTEFSNLKWLHPHPSPVPQKLWSVLCLPIKRQAVEDLGVQIPSDK